MKPEMQKYKIVISYDGTDYFGWQRQPKNRTIQGTLEETLTKITKSPVSVIGAGRTDAGVHALGQTAHFMTGLKIRNRDFQAALNSLLPRDIRIITLMKAGPDFHARKSARSKIYRYRIFNSRKVSPFTIRYVHWYPYPLDFTAMKKAAALFVREADFTPFSSNRILNPVRTVTGSRLVKKDDEIVFTIQSGGFLRYMVRVIAGTLLEVGSGKIPYRDIETIFHEGKRALAGPTAPASGLHLVKVIY